MLLRFNDAIRDEIDLHSRLPAAFLDMADVFFEQIDDVTWLHRV